MYKLPTVLQRMFYWTAPFSDGVWCLLLVSIVAAAIAMPLFERGTRGDSEDFASGNLHSRGELAGHALFLAAMAPANYATFAPTTAAGRMAAALHAFSLLLVMCSYTANLAAQLTTSQPPYQAIKDITSFSAALPLCMRTSLTAQTLLNSTFPAVAATLLDSNVFSLSTYGSRQAIDAVLAGQCAGAFLPSTEAAWLLNVNDTRGELCAAVPVAAPVGEEGVPLTFAVPGLHAGALTEPQLEAVNVAISEMHRDGAFLLSLRAQFFPDPPRGACAAVDSADQAAFASLLPASQLEPIDLAGAFLLQGIGILLGVAFHCSKGVRRRWVPSSKPVAAAGDDVAALLAQPPLPRERSAKSAAPRGRLPMWDMFAGGGAPPAALSRAASGKGKDSQQRTPRRDAQPPASAPSQRINPPCWPLV